MKKELLAVAMLLFAGGNLLAQPHVNDGTSYLMNQPLDMSTDFRDLSNTLFFADHLESFDAKSGEGLVNWKRGHLMPRQAFNTNGAQPRKMRMLDFPFTAYENDPNLKFKIDFVTPRTVRIRMLTTPVEPKPAASIMLAKEEGLSLIPAKISGACGRLMCCLAYEQKSYEYLNSITPQPGSVVRTPDGEGTVLEANVVAGTLKVRSNVESLAPKIYKRSECTYLRGGRRAPVEPDPDHT